MDDKRGLSRGYVITSLILILLVLVAVGIVWVVIKNLISGGVEQVSLGMFTLNMEIENVKIQPDGNLSVLIKRNPGEADLKSIKFAISDGTNSQVIERQTTLQELGRETFIFTPVELDRCWN